MTGQLLQQRLDSILSFIETSAKQSVAFAQDQAPSLVQEILRWRLIVNGLQALICLALLIALFFGWRYHWKKAVELEESTSGEWLLGFGMTHFAYVPVALLLGGLMLEGSFDVLQILVAPKIFLIEYAASFLK